MDSSDRQEYIKAAVNFLQNPKLIDSQLDDKLKFLKEKGLTDVEVNKAINLALASRPQPQSGNWNLFVVIGLCIGGYKLYKAYLESKNLPEDKSESFRTNKEQHNDLDRDKPNLNDIMKELSDLKHQIEHMRSNISTNIQSLKTLLLGHDKFAAPPVIPEWQLKDLDEEKEK